MSTNETEVRKKPKPLASLKVRAFEPGYFGHGPLGQIYRNALDVFTITPRTVPMLNAEGKPELDLKTGLLKTQIVSVEQQFSPRWMEVVDANEPERLTTAKDELARQVEELNMRGRSAEESV